jgi:hypothetical protein
MFSFSLPSKSSIVLLLCLSACLSSIWAYLLCLFIVSIFQSLLFFHLHCTSNVFHPSLIPLSLSLSLAPIRTKPMVLPWVAQSNYIFLEATLKWRTKEKNKIASKQTTKLEKLKNKISIFLCADKQGGSPQNQNSKKYVCYSSKTKNDKTLHVIFQQRGKKLIICWADLTFVPQVPNFKFDLKTWYSLYQYVITDQYCQSCEWMQQNQSFSFSKISKLKSNLSRSESTACFLRPGVNSTNTVPTAESWL